MEEGRVEVTFSHILKISCSGILMVRFGQAEYKKLLIIIYIFTFTETRYDFQFSRIKITDYWI